MLSAGTSLAGRYQILSLVGSGGMGEVYRARDLRLQRDVAVKALPERMTRDASALSRFEREAQALAALSHPNILTVHDSGSEGGVSYFVMELLEGETLRQRLGRGALSWRDAVDWGVLVARALGAAHSKGIIHRDLKPENVFLTPDRGLKILDFGLAELRDAGGRDNAPVDEALKTDPQVVMGTVNYMAPEQLRGLRADARSDLFALGCILYEMVSRSRPFARPTLTGTMAAILAGETPELSEPFQSAPPALQGAILRCLRAEPAERFQTAQDLAFALEMISTSAAVVVPVHAADRRPAVRAVRPSVLTLGGAALLALGLWTFLPRHPTRAITSVAVLPFANESGDPEADYLGDGITESVIDGLARLPGLRVMARSTVFRYKGRALEPRAVGRELHVDAVLVGRVAQRGDDMTIDAELVETATGARVWGQRFDGAFRDVQEIEERISREISGSLSLDLTSAASKHLAGRQHTGDAEAHRLYLKGRYHWNKRTGDGFKKALAYFQQALDRDPTYAVAYAGLADTYALMGAFGFLPPAEAMEKAKASAVRALELDETLAEAHSSLGLAKLLYDWDWPESERQFKRAIELKPGYATAHHWYAEHLMAMGRSREAEAQLRIAGDLDPLSLIIATDQGRALYLARRYDDAVAQFKKVLDTEPRFVFAHICLGLTYEEKGLYDAAIREFEEVGRLSEERQALVLLAHAYGLSGRKAEARKRLGALTKAAATSYVSPHNIAIVYLGLGDDAEAFAWLDKSVAERSQWMAYLRVDPRMDRLRSDPRFAALLKRVGLAE